MSRAMIFASFTRAVANSAPLWVEDRIPSTGQRDMYIAEPRRFAESLVGVFGCMAVGYSGS